MTSKLTTETLKTASGLRIRLSAQGDNYVLRHSGQRHLLTQDQAEGLIATVRYDLQAEGARYDEFGPKKYGVAEWVEDFLLGSQPAHELAQNDEQEEQEGFDPITAANRYNADPENCSAADEDAAWFMMTSRGGW